jgi:predicted mannosyl-3-phosphoglycerate phosphatase (HAD superfamily)
MGGVALIFAEKADTHCCWSSILHERMLHYAARASFNVYLCSLQSSHRAGDIHTSSYQKQQTAGGSQCTGRLPQYVQWNK